MSKITYRLYKKGDEIDIIGLYNSVFSHQINIEFWNWKFADNPAGFPLIGIAVKNSSVIAHSSMNPVQIKVKDKIIPVAQGVDLIVSEIYRHGLISGRLISRISDLLIEEVKQNRYSPFIYGFPRSQYTLLALRIWKPDHVTRIPQLIKIINIAYIFRNLLDRNDRIKRKIKKFGVYLIPKLFNLKNSSQYPITKLSDFDTRFDIFWARISSKFKIAVIRDAKYLRWRYSQQHYIKYAILKNNHVRGFIVLRTVSYKGWRVGHIVDILAENSKIAKLLIKAALSHFYNEQADIVRCWMMKHIPYYRILHRSGFFSQKKKINFILRIYREVVSKSFLKEPRNWYLTIGDSDWL